MIFNLTQKNSIASKIIADLRDNQIQKDRQKFRLNLSKLGEIFGYEISKTFEFVEKQVETPLGVANCHVPADRIVIMPILRAAVPLHQGLLHILDDADNGFISAYRKHHKDGTFEINVEYLTCPDLEKSVFILVDTMLATGSSIDASLKAIKSYGTPKQIHVVTAIAASFGVQYIRRYYPSVHIWVGAMDDELTAKSYIVPGLGDAGDLAYGNKLQD